MSFVLLNISKSSSRATIGQRIAETFVKNPDLTRVYVALATLGEEQRKAFDTAANEVEKGSAKILGSDYSRTMKNGKTPTAAQTHSGLKGHIERACEGKNVKVKVPDQALALPAYPDVPLGYTVSRVK